MRRQDSASSADRLDVLEEAAEWMRGLQLLCYTKYRALPLYFLSCCCFCSNGPSTIPRTLDDFGKKYILEVKFRNQPTQGRIQGRQFPEQWWARTSLSPGHYKLCVVSLIWTGISCCISRLWQPTKQGQLKGFPRLLDSRALGKN